MPRAAAGAPGLPVELRDAFGLTAAALDWAAALGAGTDPLQLEVSPRRRGALGTAGRGIVSRGGQGGARGYLFIYLFAARDPGRTFAPMSAWACNLRRGLRRRGRSDRALTAPEALRELRARREHALREDWAGVGPRVEGARKGLEAYLRALEPLVERRGAARLPGGKKKEVSWTSPLADGPAAKKKKGRLSRLATVQDEWGLVSSARRRGGSRWGTDARKRSS